MTRATSCSAVMPNNLMITLSPSTNGDPGTNVAMSVMLDDLGWWSALLAHGRAHGELPPAVFRMRAALAALPPE